MCFQEVAPTAAAEAHARSERHLRRPECESRLINTIDLNFKGLNWSYESQKVSTSEISL